MTTIFRKSLIAGAIAALISSPGWAAGTSAEAGAQGGASPAAETQAGTPAATNSLYSMTPQQLRRMDVVGAAGEEIGDVKQVVRGRDEEKIHVVINAGGFLGVGGKEIAVPLEDLTLVEDKLRLNATKEELQARPEYVEEQYVELQPSDQPISDFAAFEPTPGQEGQQQPQTSPMPGEQGGATTPGVQSAPMESPTQEQR